MVEFESFDLICNIIIVLINTALAMIHIQIMFFFTCDYSFITINIIAYLDFFNFRLFSHQDHLKTLVGPKSIDHVVDVRLQFAIGQVQLLQGGLFLLKMKGISNQYSCKRRPRYSICHLIPVSG